MQEELNAGLCSKFAAELIEMVCRFKDNKERNATIKADTLQDDGVEYGIPSTGLKNFFKACIEPLEIYIPLSVGQPKHVGGQASSQIACLENLRDGVEQWLRQQPPHVLADDAEAMHKTYYWPITFVAADSLQTLNNFKPIGIDLGRPSGQCIELLNNKDLALQDGHFYQMGLETIQFYRAQFKKMRTQRQENSINIRFDFKPKSIHWQQLKKYYDDDKFVEMVNYLESCFKYGVKLNLDNEAKASSKYGNKVMPHNWQERVKLNDICYVIAEIVMLHYKILKAGDSSVEKVQKFILYSGPLEMLLGTGKNMLAVRFSHYLKSQSCYFLRTMPVIANESEDQHLTLFKGTITADGVRVMPDEELRQHRYKYIHNIIGEEGLQKVHMQFLTRFAVEVKQQATRKREKFASSPHYLFLDSFAADYDQFREKIVKLEASKQLEWYKEDPIAGMIRYCSGYLEENQNYHNYFSIEIAQRLHAVLQNLHSKFKNKIARQREYLKRCACSLVSFIIEIRSHVGDVFPQHKRTKLTSSLDAQNLSEVIADFSIPDQSHENLTAGLCFFLHHLMNDHFAVQDLMHPDYYPDTHCQVEYRSTQESLANSGADYSNSSQPSSGK